MLRLSYLIIVLSLVLSVLCSVATAHETHQPTGLLVPNSHWKFDDDGEQDAGWKTLEFDDSAWNSAKSPLGYGETYLNKPYLSKGKIDYFLRRDFMVKDRSAIRSLILRVRYDDAFMLYLNGQELIRTHPFDGSKVPVREAKKFETFQLPSAALRNGRNIIAVKLVNQGRNSSDIVWDANLLAGDALHAAPVVVAPEPEPEPEPKAGAVDGIVRGPYLQNACEGAITIRWRTNNPCRLLARDERRTLFYGRARADD